LESFDPDSDQVKARLVQLHRYAQVGKCVNGVTHDINNLLGAAMAYAELASFDERISPDTARMLSQIVDGITKCSQLISSLTSIARRDRLDINLVAPDRLMDDVITLRDYELKMKQIAVEKVYDPEIGAMLLDLPKVKVALIYLLVNAQDAVSEKTDRRVRITIKGLEDFVEFQFWDSGGGLAPEHVESAFQPLTSHWGDGEHVGLGLFAARQIAELHEGGLTYDPAKGFCFRLKRDNGLSKKA
jgi:two-component system NtrC family sensor kinase